MERKQWRKDYIDQFLVGINVSRTALANSTFTYMEDSARQVQLATTQASANWNAPVLNLCKAVESELACSFGEIPGLEFLSEPNPLGDKIRKLKGLKNPVKQSLSSRGIKLGYVSQSLPDQLSDLNKLRTRTGRHAWRRRSGSGYGSRSAQSPTNCGRNHKGSDPKFTQ